MRDRPATTRPRPKPHSRSSSPNATASSSIPTRLPALQRLAARVPLAALSNGNADLARDRHRSALRASSSARANTARPSRARASSTPPARGLDVASSQVLHVGDDVEMDVVGAAPRGPAHLLAQPRACSDGWPRDRSCVRDLAVHLARPHWPTGWRRSNPANPNSNNKKQPHDSWLHPRHRRQLCRCTCVARSDFADWRAAAAGAALPASALARRAGLRRRPVHGSCCRCPTRTAASPRAVLGVGDLLDPDVLRRTRRSRCRRATWRLASALDAEARCRRCSWAGAWAATASAATSSRCARRPCSPLRATTTDDARHSSPPASRVRDLVNTPTEHMGPDQLEQVCCEIAERFGAKIEVVSGDDLLTQQLPGDPRRRPRLASRTAPDCAVAGAAILMRAGRIRTSRIVGKGVCFDTGGLDHQAGRRHAQHEEGHGRRRARDRAGRAGDGAASCRCASPCWCRQSRMPSARMHSDPAK